MRNPKVFKNAICPFCTNNLTRLTNPYEMVCDAHGDVTLTHYNEHLKERWIKKLDKFVEFSSYYEYCTSCYQKHTHLPVFKCCRCQGKVQKMDMEITFREWINRAVDEKTKTDRIKEFTRSSSVKTDILFPEFNYTEQENHYLELFEKFDLI